MPQKLLREGCHLPDLGWGTPAQMPWRPGALWLGVPRPGVDPTSQPGASLSPHPHLRVVTSQTQARLQAVGNSGTALLGTGRGLTQVAEAAVQPRVAEAGPVEAVAAAPVGTVALLTAMLAVETLGAAWGEVARCECPLVKVPTLKEVF